MQPYMDCIISYVTPYSKNAFVCQFNSELFKQTKKKNHKIKTGLVFFVLFFQNMKRFFRFMSEKQLTLKVLYLIVLLDIVEKRDISIVINAWWMIIFLVYTIFRVSVCLWQFPSIPPTPYLYPRCNISYSTPGGSIRQLQLAVIKGLALMVGFANYINFTLSLMLRRVLAYSLKANT